LAVSWYNHYGAADHIQKSTSGWRNCYVAGKTIKSRHSAGKTITAGVGNRKMTLLSPNCNAKLPPLVGWKTRFFSIPQFTFSAPARAAA
jgi:hypothetical protein